MRTLVFEEQSIVVGGSCYCKPCLTCEELFVGLNLRECINLCNSKRWAQEAVFYNPKDCDNRCLGKCFTKCDIGWQGLLEEISGIGSTQQRDMCKGDCYKGCKC